MSKNEPRLSSRRGAFFFFKSVSRRDAVRLGHSCFLHIDVSSRRRASCKFVFLQIGVSSRRRACFVTYRRFVEARRAWLFEIVVSSKRCAFLKVVFFANRRLVETPCVQ